jgi:ABC-type oligopeptide transport system substrate-binding subunit
MKKIFALILAASLLLSVAACSKADKSGNSSSAVNKETGTEADAGSNADADKNKAGTDAVVLLPGELYQFDKDDAGGPVIKGVNMAGNQLGSTEFNTKDPDVKGIRCVFELNEWVEIYPDTSIANGIYVYVFKHAEDAKVYTEMAYTEEDTRVLATCTLEKPEEAEYQWGAFYLNPEYADPGVYDIVFVKGGKAVAVMEAKFFDSESLGDISDDDLRALMKNF